MYSMSTHLLVFVALLTMPAVIILRQVSGTANGFSSLSGSTPDRSTYNKQSEKKRFNNGKNTNGNKNDDNNESNGYVS